MNTLETNAKLESSSTKSWRLRSDTDNIKENQMENLELKNTTPKTKSSVNGLNGRMEETKERLIELGGGGEGEQKKLSNLNKREKWRNRLEFKKKSKTSRANRNF